MLKINKISSSGVVDYAAEELKKYIRMMMPEAGDVKISYAPDATDGFRLGVMADFGLDTSDAESTELDDIIYIDCLKDSGIIAGSNERSVLLSVYEFLRRNGCRWLYPGVDGEYIPMKDIEPVRYRHLASCRYRGECLEGTNSQRTLLDAIDLAPKLGMNVFMFQFKVPRVFYNMYYEHINNAENRAPEKVSDTQILQWKRQCEAEIAKRGLQFHDIGHGWTVEPFGIKFEASWNKVDPSTVPAGSVKYLPKIDGRRGLCDGKPINTNFCMSNPEARRIFVNYVTDYAEGHSNVDYIHVWLADGKNNSCECEGCQTMRPADWYVVLMNELDEALSERGLKTRIVFIQYLDTTWAPKKEFIKNPDRFALLTAPITRNYSFSMPTEKGNEVASEYVRNKNTLPDTLEKYLAHLSEWRKSWVGPTFSFEYYFWLNQCYDMSSLHLARLVNEDVKAYLSMNVDGIISCGSQRSFFPTGAAFYSLARSMFDSSLSADEIIEDYLSHAFGEDWRRFADYLKKIQSAMPYELFSLQRGRRHHTIVDDKNVAILAEVKNVIESGRELIRSHLNSDVRVRTVAVRLLEKHAQYCEAIAEITAERARGRIDTALDMLDKFKVRFGKHEAEIEEYFDHNLHFRAMRLLMDKCAYDVELGN